MTLAPRVNIAAMLLALAGCARVLPPPRRPDRALSAQTAAALATTASAAASEARAAEPQYPPPPPDANASSTPSTGPLGVLAIEVTDGPARVERVLERTTLRPSRVVLAPRIFGRAGRTGAVPARVFIRVEPVCIAPCVARVPFGSHELRVTPLDAATRGDRLGPPSQQESLESSAVFRMANTVDVVVSDAPSALRVTLGRRRAPLGAQFGGAFATLIGTGLTLIGALMLPPAVFSGQADLRNASLVLSGIGLVSGSVGIGLIVGFPNEVQPASSRQWRVRAPLRKRDGSGASPSNHTRVVS